MDLTELFTQQFERAAGKAAVFELEIRLVADKTPELTKFAHEQTLNPILTPFIEHFTAQLSDEDKQMLKTAQVLRNKIVHGDFKAAADKLDQPSGGVTHFKGLPTEGKHLVKFFQGVADGKLAGTPVRQQSAKAVGVFGWLLEGGRNGTFAEAEKAFRSAIAIVDRLSSGCSD